MTYFLWACAIASVFASTVWFDAAKGAMHEMTAVTFLLIAAVCLAGAAINTRLGTILQVLNKNTEVGKNE